MVAYSFKKRFAEPILAGTKTQTIRKPRARHARPGEVVSLYTGMRTKQCKLIARRDCLDVSPIVLDFYHGRVESHATGTAWTTPDALDAFARRDGFADWDALCEFWREEHGALERFEGVLIRWAPKAEAV